VGDAVEIKFETWKPRHQSRLVPVGDLADVYKDAPVEMSPTFTWNDGGDQVLIVSVGADYSTVTMLNDDTFSDLVISDDNDLREICIAGQESAVAVATLLPRETGLEVLRRAENFDELLDVYSWRAQ